MKLHEQIQITAELLGRPLSDLAVTVLARELGRYPSEDVRAALDRCVRESPRALTFAEVTARLPGAHLAADEAWAIVEPAYDESASVVWTAEMAEAFGIVRHLGDRVAARMAFRSAYERLVGVTGERPRWDLSAGFDRDGREVAVRGAIAAGRLSSGDHVRLLGAPAPRDVPDRLESPVAIRELLGESVRAAEFQDG